MDGACEDEGRQVSCGGLLVDPEGGNEVFGFVIPEWLLTTWRGPMHKKQLIGQTEILPILVSRLLWSDRLRGRRVFIYVDNDAARYACIRGWSEAVGSNEMIRALAVLDARGRSLSFFARVPSKSNPADEASRGLVAEVALKFHARAVEVTACALSAWLGSVGVVACMT
eukprot:2325579-Amphidinium_carterae.1